IKISSIIKYAYNVSQEYPDSARDLGNKSIELSKKINWKLGEANGFLLLSYLYANDLRYDTAVSLAMQSLAIAEIIRDHWIAAIAHRNLSEFYRMLGEDSLTQSHGKKYLEQATLINNERMILEAQMTLYNIYAENGNKTEAKRYAALTMSNALSQNNESVMARIFEIEGGTKFDEKDFINSLANYRQALTLYRRLNGRPYVAYVETQLSRVFANLKIKDSAEFYSLDALEFSTKNNLNKEKIDAYQALFKNAHYFGEFKKAFDYLLIYDSLKDEMNSEQVSRGAKRSQLEFEQKKKDLLAQAEQQKKDIIAKRTKALQLTIFLFT
ncbi:MAG: hypothetical protein ABUL44_00260, partial [Flavobacterium sp.]